MERHNEPGKKERVDEGRVNRFCSVVMKDLDATANCLLAYIGDKLGLYKAMAKAEDNAVTSQELANVTGTNERYIRDWLAEQASKQYVLYNSTTGKYSLPEEHAAVLADETSQTCLAGGFQLLVSILKHEPKISEAFGSGCGFEWGEYDEGVIEGQARLNSSQYRANLTTSWIPALVGVEDKLRRSKGAKVADIGCGYGISTTIMAKAYPNSSFVGVDNHHLSIERARIKSARQGLGNEDRLKFIMGSAETLPKEGGYDLVTFFDCFHDMGDPFGVARHVKELLKPDGTLMLVEMEASDKLEENIESAVGTNGYAGSIFVCLPTAFAEMNKQDKFSGRDGRKELDALPLGGMAGPSAIERLLRTCGYSKFRCALKDGFNMVLEAKP